VLLYFIELLVAASGVVRVWLLFVWWGVIWVQGFAFEFKNSLNS
jgi:hypothetical protein